MSLEGTLAGVAAVARHRGARGLRSGSILARASSPVVVAAFVGTTLESVVGATLEQRRLLDNEALNFLNTLVGALVAVALAPLVPGSVETAWRLTRR